MPADSAIKGRAIGPIETAFPACSQRTSNFFRGVEGKRSSSPGTAQTPGAPLLSPDVTDFFSVVFLGALVDDGLDGRAACLELLETGIETPMKPSCADDG